MADEQQSFETWMQALREHLRRQWPDAGEDYLGPERWRGYFDQGFTPEQALAEEQGFGSEA
jgi:hypothetical protein